jgi:nucleoside diphosphate kinase
VAEELAMVIINPYTLFKSRTGGVISRLLSRGNYELAAARMFSPGEKLIDEFCRMEELEKTDHPAVSKLIVQYIRENYSPDPRTGARKRLMVLLFKGDDVVNKLRTEVVGHITRGSIAGETIRDTYGDYVLDQNGAVKYFEPAVLVIPGNGGAEKTLNLWAKYSDSDGGLLRDVVSFGKGVTPEMTLVLIKPDNFKGPSSRAGYIVDLLSKSGLFIIAAQVIRMSVAQAEEFYGPVKEVFITRLKDRFVGRVCGVLEKEFEFAIPEKVKSGFCEQLNILNAEHEFNKIITFMTGLDPAVVKDPAEKEKPGNEKCLALVYQGKGAVAKIRNILGTTDPSKAAPATVRKEFGQNIMVNTAHASDSAENARREMRIIGIEENNFKKIIEDFYKK